MIKVVVNGTFDIVHPGHLALLNYAKSLGDFLIVAIDTDERVQQLKGTSRPINTCCDRKTLLENLRSVDQVLTFSTDQELIDIVSQCSIMVKGSDYCGKPILGSDLIDIVFYDRTAHSTTQSIQNIISRR